MSGCLFSGRHLSVVPEGASNRLLSRRNVKRLVFFRWGGSALNTTQVSRHLRWNAGQCGVGVVEGRTTVWGDSCDFLCLASRVAEGQRSRSHSADKLWRKLTSRSPSGGQLRGIHYKWNCISVNLILGSVSRKGNWVTCEDIDSKTQKQHFSHHPLSILLTCRVADVFVELLHIRQTTTCTHNCLRISCFIVSFSSLFKPYDSTEWHGNMKTKTTKQDKCSVATPSMTFIDWCTQSICAKPQYNV